MTGTTLKRINVSLLVVLLALPFWIEAAQDPVPPGKPFQALEGLIAQGAIPAVFDCIRE